MKIFTQRLLEKEQIEKEITINLSINGIIDPRDPHNFGKWTFPLCELDRILKNDLMYSPAHYEDDHRLNTKVIRGSINCIALDFDDGMTLEEAKNIFGRYEGVIATTRSHQKDKHGIVCDRFRVIIPTDTPIDLDYQEYSRLMANVMEIYTQADKSCKNASRFYFATEESKVFRLQGDKLFDWKRVNIASKKVEEVKEVERLASPSSYVSSANNETTEADIESALNRITPDCDYAIWTDIGMALKSELGDSGLQLWDNWSRRSNKYNEKEMKNKWKSFSGSGIGIGTLFHHAK